METPQIAEKPKKTEIPQLNSFKIYGNASKILAYHLKILRYHSKILGHS